MKRNEMCGNIEIESGKLAARMNFGGINFLVNFGLVKCHWIQTIFSRPKKYFNFIFRAVVFCCNKIEDS